ncbi:FecR family protein [Spirosoma soli]|uniref:FecR family protein n=1 Tax=Spirosoma soli TaxID=1770529 RepID=A0ABW5M0G4_9BACT
MEDIVNKAVLFDYFSGRVSPLQKKSVEHWLSELSNRELYYQWLHEWELERLQTNTNWQPMFEKTAHRIHHTPPESPPAEEQRPASWSLSRTGEWMRRHGLLAASVVLVLMAASWWFRDVLLYKTVQTSFGETRRLTLPDGSVVILNANSTLRFARWFGSSWLPNPTSFGKQRTDAAQAIQQQRTVELTGEADFAVRHLPDQQRFVVLTPKGLNVTVLGTQFTVYSRERATRVALRSGRVELTTRQPTRSPLIMNPGDLVTLNRQGKLALTRTAHPEAMAAWVDHRFEFERTSLREVAQLLHENYGLTVTIANAQLASRTISGSFTARNANELLQLISQLLQVNYIRENDRVSFTD